MSLRLILNSGAEFVNGIGGLNGQDYLGNVLEVVN